MFRTGGSVTPTMSTQRLRRHLPAFILFVLAVQAPAHTTPQAGTVAANRREYEQQLALLYRFRAEAEQAWDDEMAREKAGDCNGRRSTYELNMCMVQRVTDTLANYKRYRDAVRAMRGVRLLGDGDASGPSGTPPTQEEAIRRFDAADATWQTYREELCALEADMTRGGTAAPFEGMSCTLLLVRNHMRDIGLTFGR